MLFSALPQPTIPRSPLIAQVHVWPSILFCVSFCPFWSLSWGRLLLSQLHTLPFPPRISGCLPSLSHPRSPESQLILVKQMAKIWGEMQATLSPHCHPLLVCGTLNSFLTLVAHSLRIGASFVGGCLLLIFINYQSCSVLQNHMKIRTNFLL